MRQRVDEALATFDAKLDDPWLDGRRVAFITATWDHIAERAIAAAEQVRETLIADFHLDVGLLVDVRRVRTTPESLVASSNTVLAAFTSGARRPRRFQITDRAKRGLGHRWSRVVQSSPQWARIEMDQVPDDREVEVGPRWLLPPGAEREGLFDDLGFLQVDAARAAGAIGASRLLFLKSVPVVVSAGPWEGKSFVAGHLEKLARNAISGRFHSFSNLDTGGELAVPPWWEAWRRSELPGVWLVDGFDEAFHRGSTAAIDALYAWSDLDDEAKSRLALVVFTRPDDSLDPLRRLWPERQELQLLPVDRREAERALERFPGGLARILGRLEELGETPLRQQIKALEAIASGGGAGSAVDVRRLVVEREVTQAARGSVDVDSKLLGEAAECLALATFMLDDEWLDFRGRGEGVCVADVFGGRPELAAAARQLDRTAGIVRGARGHRFSLQFLREQLAALALHRVPKARRASIFREILTNQDGIRPSMSAVVAVLEETDSNDIARLREVLPIGADVAMQRFVAVVDAARRGPVSGFRWASQLERLVTPETSTTALTLFASTSEPVSVRMLALDLLEFTPRSAIEKAVAVATNPHEPPLLRSSAVFFVLGQREAHFLEALAQVAETPSADEVFETARAAILLDQLQRGAAALAIAGRAPLPTVGMVDHRRLLMSALEASLVNAPVADARAVVDAWLAPEGGALRLAPEMIQALAPTAFRRLLYEERWTDDDVVRAARLLEREDWDIVDDELLEKKLASDSSARRRIYARGPEAVRALVRLVVEEDAEWLIQQAGGFSELPSSIELGLARIALGGGPFATVAQLSLERAGVWDRVAIEREAIKERTAQWEARSAAREPAPRTPIRDLVAGAFVEDRSPEELVRYLGAAFFAGDQGFSDVGGEFDDLPRAEQTRLVARGREMLAQALPTTLPQLDYSSWHLYESATFVAVALRDDEVRWLSPEMVGRWLPTVLRVEFERQTAVMDVCAWIAPDETVRAILGEIAGHAGSRGGMLAQHVPDWLWDDRRGLAEGVETILRSDEAFPGADGVRARIWLLGELARRQPRSPVIRELADHVDANIADAALGLALARDPDLLAEVERRASTPERVATAVLPVFHGKGGRVTFVDWPPNALYRLIALIQDYVPSTDTLIPAGRVYTGSDLIRVAEGRDAALAFLLTKRDEQSAQAIDDLSSRFPALAPKIEWVGANAEAEAVLAPAESPFSIADVRALLSKGRHLPVRTTDGLFDRLVELLNFIGLDSRSSAEVVMEGDTPGHEVKRFQPYLRMRLGDLWNSWIGDHVAKPVWSPNDRANSEPDFVVTFEGSSIAIEIKWSHHKDVVDGYRSQLGEGYVIEPRRKHGIYIVGWSNQTSETRMTIIKDGLQLISADFKQLGIRLAYVVLDLRPFPASSNR